MKESVHMLKKNYSVIRNYKKFKSIYPEFVVFIKCGEYYYTYDSDSRILMYLYQTFREDMSFRIEKNRFNSVLYKLHQNNLNVVLAGEKKANEYYTSLESKYRKIKKISKDYYDATITSVLQD